MICSPYAVWPPTSGGAVRTVEVARALAALNTGRTRLLAARPIPMTPDETGGIDWLGYRHIPRRGYFYNGDFRRVYQQTLRDDPPDLILVSMPYQSRMIVGPARAIGAAIVYDAHNLEADRFRLSGQKLLSKVVRSFEGYLCRHASAILAVSENDRALFQSYYGRDALLLPNGVDANRFQPGTPDPALLTRYGLTGRTVALFCGTLDYPPNTQALRYLLEQAWPTVRQRRPEATLLIVGRRPPAWAYGHEQVIVAGEVDDMAAHNRLAHWVLAPLTSGGGTRLKILEAMACGQRVLSTPFGAMGITSESREGLLLSEIEDYAERLADALATPEAPGTCKAARDYSLRFHWQKLVDAVDWRALAQAGQGRRP